MQVGLDKNNKVYTYIIDTFIVYQNIINSRASFVDFAIKINRYVAPYDVDAQTVVY